MRQFCKRLLKFYPKTKPHSGGIMHNRMNTLRPNEPKHFFANITQSVYNELFFSLQLQAEIHISEEY